MRLPVWLALLEPKPSRPHCRKPMLDEITSSAGTELPAEESLAPADTPALDAYSADVDADDRGADGVDCADYGG